MHDIFTPALRVQDQEAEVRTAAAEAVVDFCEHAPLSKPAFMSEIMLPLKSLAADSNQSVRVALASRVLQLTPRCVHEDASTHVLDLILALLKDKVRPPPPPPPAIHSPDTSHSR